MDVVGEGDEEVICVGGDAKGEGVDTRGLVFTGGDFGFCFEPRRLCDRGGCHALRISAEKTRRISCEARAT